MWLSAKVKDLAKVISNVSYPPGSMVVNKWQAVPSKGDLSKVGLVLLIFSRSLIIRE